MRRWVMRLGLPLGVVVLAGVVLVAWPLVWPADPDASLKTVGGRQVGEATGYVVSLDPEAGVLKISSSIFGLRPVTLAVDANTPITVRDKQGGLGDLAVDMPVRVAYEIQGHMRHARSVELVVPESASRVRLPSDVLTPAAGAAPTPSAETPSPVRPTPAAAAVEGAPKQPPVAPAPAVDAAPKRPSVTPAPAVDAAPKRPPVAPVPAVDVAPKRPPLPAMSAPTPPPARKVAERPRPAPPAPAREPVEDEKALEAAAARREAAAARAPRPADDGGAVDGTAAIDWLLRSRDR